jgi:Bacterial pre-peptidase C-terminal domain
MRPRAVRAAWCMIVIVAGIVTADTHAQTSYPMILYVEPVAVSRGQSAEITIVGRENFTGAWKLLCEGPGLTGEVQIVENAQPTTKARGAAGGRRGATAQVRARLHVSPDAPLGPRELRVATPQGVSSVGLVVVVDGPVVSETPTADAANDRPASAQMVTLPCVASGRIARAEDVDWYAFELAKGQRVGFEIWGNRIENKIHDLQTHLDPILSLHNSAGRELAAADNNRFADPLLTFEAPEAGTYFLQVRDTTYAGNPAWAYALLAATAPITTSAYPLAVNPGTTALLELHGPGTDPANKVPLAVPPLLDSGPHLFALSQKPPGSLPFPLVVTPLPISPESTDAPASGDPGKTIKLPAALCGRLAQRGDSDGYAFDVHKNLIYTFEAMARRAGSECDPVLRLLDSKGAILTEVDDSPGMGKDARIEWKAPADGTYTVQVTDLHGRGGEAFPYVLLAQQASPDFSVTCDPDMINVGPGGRVPLFVRLTRRAGFAGAVRLGLNKLPPGVTASPLVIPPSMTEGVIVIEAAPDAKRESLLLALNATGLGEGAPIIHQASPLEEIYLPGGGRGHFPVHTLALAVTDPSDITVEATPREVVLSPGESVPVDVTVTRNPRYEQGVNLAVMLQHLGGIHGNPLPPGVKLKEAGSKTLLGPKETKGKIVIEAAANAPPSEKVPITIMGHVSINFVVKTAYCSSPILVTVRPKGAAGAR